MADLGSYAFETSRLLLRCETLDELAALFQRRIAALAITVSASGMVTGPKAGAANPFHFTNWPQPWLDQYHAKGYIHRDPLPRWAIVSGLPATWSALMQSLPRNDPGHEIYAEAVSWGFREGMVIPLRSHSGNLGLVTMGGDRSALTLDEAAFLQAVSTTLFHQAEALSQTHDEEATLPKFSHRENECITLVRQGLTDKEIAQVLGVSTETVRSHIGNARVKAGARSRTHLAAIAYGQSHASRFSKVNGPVDPS